MTQARNGQKPFGRRVSSLAGGEKRDSEENHLLKTVASRGPWYSEEQSEEALMTNPNFGPNCRQNELGLRSWHREEQSEEDLLTKFGPREEPGQQGLLTLLLSMPRPPAQLILAAIWPKVRAGCQGLLTLLLRVPRSLRCHPFEEVRF